MATPFASAVVSFKLPAKPNKAGVKVTLRTEVVSSAGWEMFRGDRVVAELVGDGHLRLHRPEDAAPLSNADEDDQEDEQQARADRFRELPVYHEGSVRVLIKPEVITLLISRPSDFKDGFLFEQARSGRIDLMTNAARLRRHLES